MTQPTQQTPVSQTVLTPQNHQARLALIVMGSPDTPKCAAEIKAHNAELCRLLRRVDYVFDVLDKCEYFWEVDKNLIAEVWQELRTKAAPVFQEPSSREFGWGQEDEKGVG